jgi:hypothetical protein
MQGWNIAEAGHAVNLLPPQSITGGTGTISPGFSMKLYKHATIIILLGAEASQLSGNLLVQLLPTATGTGIDIPFNYYCQAAGGAGGDDVLSAINNAPATGLVLSASNAPANGMIVIEIDANELESASGALAGTALAGSLGPDKYVSLVIPSAAAANFAAVVVVLSGAREAYAQSPSVTV